MSENGSKRKVVTESEILAQVCPTCNARQQMGCRSTIDRSRPLTLKLESTEMAFHPRRITAARNAQLARHFGNFIGPTEKALIVYYAFVMLCDSCSANSMKLFGREFTSIEIQKLFAHEAIEELKKDELI